MLKIIISFETEGVRKEKFYIKLPCTHAQEFKEIVGLPSVNDLEEMDKSLKVRQRLRRYLQKWLNLELTKSNPFLINVAYQILYHEYFNENYCYIDFEE